MRDSHAITGLEVDITPVLGAAVCLPGQSQPDALCGLC